MLQPRLLMVLFLLVSCSSSTNHWNIEIDLDDITPLDNTSVAELIKRVPLIDQLQWKDNWAEYSPKYSAQLRELCYDGNPFAMTAYSDTMSHRTYDWSNAYKLRMEASSRLQKLMPRNEALVRPHFARLAFDMNNFSLAKEEWDRCSIRGRLDHAVAYLKSCEKTDNQAGAFQVILQTFISKPKLFAPSTFYQDILIARLVAGDGQPDDPLLIAAMGYLLEYKRTWGDELLKDPRFDTNETPHYAAAAGIDQLLDRLAQAERFPELLPLIRLRERLLVGGKRIRKHRLFAERAQKLIRDSQQAIRVAVDMKDFKTVDALTARIQETKDAIAAHNKDSTVRLNAEFMTLKATEAELAPVLTRGGSIKMIWVEPEGTTSTMAESQAVTLVLQSSHGIDKLVLKVNGKELNNIRALNDIATGKEAGEDFRQESLNFIVPLTTGHNHIALTVTDLQGESHSEEMSVIRRELKGRVLGLVVGISDYGDNNINDLPYAEADARAVHRMLTGKRGIARAEDVKLLLGKNATANELKAQLFKHLVKNSHSDDTVIFYYAGHGDVGPEGKEYFMIPQDAQRDALSATAIELGELQRMWKKIKAKRRVFITDACNSGGFTTLRGDADKSYSKVLGEGSAVLAASSSGQKSMEDPRLGHGLFTWCLLNGLGGKADTNKDERISLNELAIYVQREVSTEARKRGSAQKPVSRMDVTGEIYLTRTP